MASRRGATGLCGLLAVDKPRGMTSHDVVAAVRRATGEGRVGHAGTLDPAATGLLIVLVGAYTRLEPYLSAEEKAYEATVAFGTATDTDDAEGAVTGEAPIPDDVFDERHAREILEGFLGTSRQAPPAYSAIKVGGRVAHRAARAGSPLEVAPRDIEVREATLSRADRASRTWDVVFRVSKGTYVRALSRDIGTAAGTVAHLAALRRTVCGKLTLRDAAPLADVLDAAVGGRLPALFLDPAAALGLPVLPASADSVADGRPLPIGASASAASTGARFSVLVEDSLAGVYRLTEAALVPEVVFPEACR